MRVFWVLVLLTVIGLMVVIHSAGKVGVGYAAKQLCSGVFVSGLPASFVLENDIEPRLATVPLLSRFLTTGVDGATASARVLTAQAEATYRPGYGCTLHGDVAESATPRSVASAQVLDSTAASQVQTMFEQRNATPEALTQIIEGAFAEPVGGGRNTLAMVVIHRGQLVAERYADPVTPSTRLQGWSMNKSLMASFVGIQVGKGNMALTDNVAARLTALGVSPKIFAGLSDAMNLKHLMSMTSGLDFEERYFPGDDVTEMLYGHGPMWQVPVGLGQRHEPGEVFSYSSGDTNVVSFLWQNTLGDEPYITWLQREVYTPLALTEPLLEPDVAGFQVGSSFANLTARDWARVGQWWLDAWQGRDALLSQDWQRTAVTPGVSVGGANYGLGFWLNTEQRIFPGLSENTFHSGGNSGQFVVVIPEAELVVVRLGLTLEESKSAMVPVLVALNDYFAKQMPKPTSAAKDASALP
jgi:CubicO group peptidase (beta-lactamase class C family)